VAGSEEEHERRRREREDGRRRRRAKISSASRLVWFGPGCKSCDGAEASGNGCRRHDGGGKQRGAGHEQGRQRIEPSLGLRETRR
jgi:hypothetical protein